MKFNDDSEERYYDRQRYDERSMMIEDRRSTKSNDQQDRGWAKKKKINVGSSKEILKD